MTTIILVMGTVVLLSSYLIYQAHRVKEQNKLREQLQANISNQISLFKNGDTPTVDLSKTTSFSWDRLYIFGPYVPLDIIQERLGYAWEPDTSLELGFDTPFSLLVFTLDGEVSQYIEYPSELANFSEAGEKVEGYKPEEAKFEMNDFGYIIWIKN